ncbi:MAG: hypothetical protein LKE40_14420 [Spirochaetia bacterium]|jgi:5-hydroxyisourate hydrolase-like protein (transthyretin family)|nr:hypothetical protein [Spirochaetia bacterium]
MRKSYGILGVVLVLLCSILVGCSFNIVNAKTVTFNIKNTGSDAVTNVEICLTKDADTKVTSSATITGHGGTLSLSLDMTSVVSTGQYYLTCDVGNIFKDKTFGSYTLGSPSESTVAITISSDADPVIAVDGD